jgi:hypothetical protein
MATHWMREVHSTSTGFVTGAPFALKAYAFLLHHVCGFGNFTDGGVSENVLADVSSGSDGEFNISGSDWQFRDSVASAFAGLVSDRHWLVIADGQRKNAGVYKITSVIDADNVVVDFRAAVTEYPIQTVGLNWWVIDNQTLLSDGSYFRCRTPHILGWEIELNYNGLPASGNQTIDVRVSINADWTVNGKILPYVRLGVVGNSEARWYGIVDDAGEYASFVVHNSTNNRHQAVLAGNMLPVELSAEDEEKVVLMGVPRASSEAFVETMTRDYNANRFGHGYAWRTMIGTYLDVWMVDYSESTFASGLVKWSSRQKNARKSNGTFDREDSIIGTWVFSDVKNEYNQYAMVGLLPGLYSVRENLGNRTNYNELELNDMIHFCGGCAFEWPGLTKQH